MRNIKCVRCCGTGSLDEMKNVCKLENEIIRIYHKISCSQCKGTGIIELSEEEYQDTITVLKKMIDKLSLELMNPEESSYIVTKECDKCKGKGDIKTKTIELDNDSYYIVTSHLCDKCYGRGCIVDIEETKKIIEKYLDVYKKDLDELIYINEIIEIGCNGIY